MSDFQILLNAPGEPASRLQIAQIGDFKHKGYGEFSITPDDIQSWKANLDRLPGKRAVIDLDHRADRSPRNSEAAGWITGVDLEDGKPMADVEWTPVGRRAIEEKRYLFFSPSYGKYETETGETFENVLQGGALTNKPFLKSLPTISLADPERVTEAYEDLYELDVSASARKQAAADGNALPDGSYPIRNATELHSAAVLAASGHGDVKAARALIKKRAGELGVSLSHLPGFSDDQSDTRKKMASVTESTLKLLDLDETADDAAVEAAIQKILEDKTAPVTEPVETDETVKQLEAENKSKDDRIKTLETHVDGLRTFADTLTKELDERRFDEAFSEALRTGRAVAGMRDTQHHFFTLDADTTLKALAEGPQIVNVLPSRWNNDKTNDPATPVPAGVAPGNFHLDQAIQKHIAETDGLSPKDYPKVLDAVLSGLLNLEGGV